jgi:hypothetical protein
MKAIGSFLTTLVFVLSFMFAAGCSTAPIQPDTKLARPLGRWPNADDLKRLESVKGQSAAGVLKALGHPKRVEHDERGERWIYPWLATAIVYFHDGVATDTFYTAGY